MPVLANAPLRHTLFSAFSLWLTRSVPLCTVRKSVLLHPPMGGKNGSWSDYRLFAVLCSGCKVSPIPAWRHPVLSPVFSAFHIFSDAPQREHPSFCTVDPVPEKHGCLFHPVQTPAPVPVLPPWHHAVCCSRQWPDFDVPSDMKHPVSQTAPTDGWPAHTAACHNTDCPDNNKPLLPADLT